MKVLLTVGHSILKSGACTSADGRPFGGFLEYAYNKGIVNQVAEYLRKAGHITDVLICPELQFTRSTDEKTYKVPRANSGGYDLVVELHLNASKLHNARGCQVLYISQKGKEVAQRIQAQLATVFKDDGVQYRDNLYMLTKTNPVAVMVESFFCDNSLDCELAEQTDVALLIAQGIHGGEIMEDTPPAQAETGILYRVQTGAFKEKINAERLRDKLLGLGFKAFIVTVDLGQLIYRVQVGAYRQKANAEAMKKLLLAAGFEAIITIA